VTRGAEEFILKIKFDALNGRQGAHHLFAG